MRLAIIRFAIFKEAVQKLKFLDSPRISINIKISFSDVFTFFRHEEH